MTRREFIAHVAGAAVASPFAAFARASARRLLVAGPDQWIIGECITF
jgi:hypothetical protein